MNDLKFAIRQLLKNPGFTTVAVLTLAFGIGANTAIFSVVNAVLLRPLPYYESERLVALCESNPHLGLDQYVTSAGAYLDWRAQGSAFSELAAAMVLGPTPLVNQNGPELVHAAAVSAEFFSLLDIQPILGRPFVNAEESPDRGNVVLLSEGLWRSRFGANPGILNQTIQLGDHSFTVVGVMPSRLKLFDPSGVQGWDNGFSKCDLWRPLPVQSGLRKQRNYRAFLVLGRLKPNISLGQAQAEMASIARTQAQEYPESNAGWNITVQPWQKTVVQNARLPLILLLSAAAGDNCQA